MDKYGTGYDPYTYPNTTILRNKLNILSQQKFDANIQAYYGNY